MAVPFRRPRAGATRIEPDERGGATDDRGGADGGRDDPDRGGRVRGGAPDALDPFEGAGALDPGGTLGRGGRLETRIEDDDRRSPSGVSVSACSRALRRSGRRSPAEPMRANELFRRHAETMSLTTPSRCGGNTGSSRRMAAVVADPPLPKGGVPTTIS